MLSRPAPYLVADGALAQEKRPVACLGQQQLAHCLGQRALALAMGMRVAPDKLSEPLLTFADRLPERLGRAAAPCAVVAGWTPRAFARCRALARAIGP